MKQCLAATLALVGALSLSGCAGLSARSLPAPVAQPGDIEAFDLLMLKPFGGMAECMSLLGEYNAARSSQSRCFQRRPDLMGTGKPLRTERLRVLLAGEEEQWLGFVFGGELQVGLIDGQVHYVGVRIRDVRMQDKAFAKVQSWFGKPAAAHPVDIAGTRVLKAAWSLQHGVQLTFHGADARLGPGSIELRSPEWQGLKKLQHAPVVKPLDA